MIDLITHVPDLTAYASELADMVEDGDPRVFKDEETGAVNLIANKIPVYYNGNQSLCLVRVAEPEYLDGIKTLKILGRCENNSYEFLSDEHRKMYENTYPREPIVTTDEETGDTYEYAPPYKIGVFA